MHHCVGIVSGSDPGRGEEAFRHSIQISLCKHDRRSGLDDVGIEIGPEFGQFLAQLFDFLSLVGRQIQTGPAIIAQGFLEQLFIFTGEFRMNVRKSFDGFVNILAIIDPDRPFLEGLHCILSSGAHCRIRICLLNDRRLVRCNSRLICEIVERHNGAFESNLAQVLSADLIQPIVGFRDRIFHRCFNRSRRLFPIGNRQNRVCLGSSGTKIIDSFRLGSQQTRRGGNNE